MKTPWQVVYQSETLLAVSKPSGLLSVPDRYDDTKPSLASRLRDFFPEARPLHRLDVETSGLMLFSLDPGTFGFYSDQFEQRQVQKTYHAICEGRVQLQEGVIDQPLFTQSTGDVIISKKGKQAVTSWALEERFQFHSLLSVRPLTGRTHQIRVHLSGMHHPIVCDTRYGATGPLYLSSLKGKKYKLSLNEEEERPLLQRIGLHATAISIRDVTSQEWLDISCPMPKDMEVTIKKLRQFSSL